MRDLFHSRSVARLWRDRRGVTAPTFAIMTVPLLTAVGAAIDYSSASSQRTQMQMALDSAAVRGCKDIQTQTVATTKTNIANAFAALYPAPTTITIDVTAAVATGAIKLTATSAYTSSFGGLFGQTKIDLQSSSDCEYANNTYEVALVMDNSGSMSESAGSKTKIQASKDAASSLIDSLYSGPTSSSRVKVSVVPFTLSVNVGSSYRTASWVDTAAQSSRHWDNFDYYNSPWKPANRFTLFDELGVTFGGCFETRPGDYAVTDVGATTGQPDSYFVPQFAPDDPGNKASSTSTYSFTVNGKATSYSYENSYLDDNTSGSGQCTFNKVAYGNQLSEVDKALTKLCKYKGNPSKNISNSRGPNYMCNGQPLLRMSNDTATIKSKINSMVANGNTNIFEGFMWGWRTISPNGPFADGRIYGQQPGGQPNNVKVIILLTDGMNAWQALSNPNGSRYAPAGFLQNTVSTAAGYSKVGRFAPIVTTTEAQGEAAMDSRLTTGCANAKAKGVIVYTIGFAQTASDVNSTVLKACASADPNTGNPLYYYAANSTQVDAVFKDISNHLSELRLTK
ncbi:TadE/TadG family type IV pilus assembly protein [Terrarubrum flagellatum]|uniref:TadE/TadG family type IV pilus assembly protein n=1 Tax=Terrirubrum flagellatum TaxID=2895980 RepID=UPI0031451969